MAQEQIQTIYKNKAFHVFTEETDKDHFYLEMVVYGVTYTRKMNNDEFAKWVGKTIGKGFVKICKKLWPNFSPKTKEQVQAVCKINETANSKES